MNDKEYLLQDDELVAVSGGDLGIGAKMMVNFQYRDNLFRKTSLIFNSGSTFSGANEEFAKIAATMWCKTHGCEFVKVISFEVL